MARLTKEQRAELRKRTWFDRDCSDALDTIAELERELGEAREDCRKANAAVNHNCKLYDKAQAQLATSPCGKHPMWAWRCKNCGAPESAHLREMPEPPTNEFVGHCILCEEVQAAEAAALERAAAIADEVATKHYRKAETSEGDVAEVIHNRIIDLMPLTPSSAGAQATSDGDMGDREPLTERTDGCWREAGKANKSTRLPDSAEMPTRSSLPPTQDTSDECCRDMRERAAECVRQYPRYEHAISAILALTPSSAGAQAETVSEEMRKGITAGVESAFTHLEDVEDDCHGECTTIADAKNGTQRYLALRARLTPVPASGGRPELTTYYRTCIRERDETIARLRQGLEHIANRSHMAWTDKKSIEFICRANEAECRALLDQAQATGEREAK